MAPHCGPPTWNSVPVLLHKHTPSLPLYHHSPRVSWILTSWEVFPGVPAGCRSSSVSDHGASQSPRDSQRMHPRVRGPGSVNSWMQGPRCTHLCTAGAQQTSFNGRLNQRPVAFPPNRHEGSTSCDLRRLGTCSPPPTPAQLKLPVGLLRAVSTHLAGKKFTWTFGQSSLFWKLCEITDPVFRILCVLIFSPIFRKTGCDVFQSFLVSDKDSRLECLVLNQ